MKRIYTFVCCLLICECACSAAKPGATILGHCYDSLSTGAMAGVSIEIEGVGLATEADEDGSFSLQAVPAGTWTMKATCVGYRTNRQVITIEAADTVAHVRFQMMPRPVEVDRISVIDDARHAEASSGALVSLSKEEIRQSPGHASDISRVISLHPSIAKSSDAYNSLSVRGGHPNETRFMIDGFTVPSINHFPLPGNSSGSYSLIRADLVSNVDFWPGGRSARYGGHLSGLMSVDLRQGRRDRVGGRIGAGLTGFHADLEGPLPSGNGSWLVSARRSLVDWLAESVDAGVAPKYTDALIKMNLDLGDRHKLNLLTVYGTDNLLITPAIALTEGYVFMGDMRATESIAGLRWKARWHSRLTATTTVSVSQVKHGVDLYRIYRNVPYALDHSRHTEGRAEWFGRWQMNPWWGLNVSADWHFTSDRIHLMTNGAVGPLGHGTTVPPVDERLSATNLGVSLTNWFALGKSVEWSAGLRADYFDRGDGWHLGPRLRVNWYPTRDWKVVAALGRLYQPLPTRLPLLAVGSDELSAPSVRDINLGIRYEFSANSISLEGYHKYYDHLPLDRGYGGVIFPFDQVGVFYTAQPFYWLVDDGRAEAYGCELVFRRNYVGSLYGILVLGLSQAHYRDIRGTWRPRYHQTDRRLGLEGGVDLGQGFTVSLRFQLQSGAPNTPVDTARTKRVYTTVYQTDQFMLSNLPVYYNANLRAEKRVIAESWTLTLYISIWNLFDKKRVLEYYWDFGSDSIAARYEWGLIPIVGIEWEF